ncbi:unnamed protein product, partial [Ectocarpus sp. 12 AP-2014]
LPTIVTRRCVHYDPNCTGKLLCTPLLSAHGPRSFTERVVQFPDVMIEPASFYCCCCCAIQQRHRRGRRCRRFPPEQSRGHGETDRQRQSFGRKAGTSQS